MASQEPASSALLGFCKSEGEGEGAAILVL